jgi:hypothetical protein
MTFGFYNDSMPISLPYFIRRRAAPEAEEAVEEPEDAN